MGGDGHRLNRDLISVPRPTRKIVAGLPEAAPSAALDPPVLDAALHAVSNDEHRDGSKGVGALDVRRRVPQSYPQPRIHGTESFTVTWV